ncbi:MAG TPA: PspC domain-containing protein [Streptosporangiaceae bacterium]|nr:PspC domain-containing protein [Streptosporangiaceae bacterium]
MNGQRPEPDRNGGSRREDQHREGWHHGWLDGHADWREHLMAGPQRSASLQRPQEGRIVGGVAAGLSARTGISVTVVRIIFVVTSFISGFGAAAYVLGWLFLPAEGGQGSIASKARADRIGIALAAGAASLLILLLLVASAVGVGWISSLSWPPVIVLAGLVLIWRNAPDNERAMMHGVVAPLLGETVPPVRSRIGLRMCAAGALLIAGLVTLLTGHVTTKLLHPLVGMILVIAAFAVLLGPWWLRIVKDLMIERQARVRAEERAEMASRVHDSVLQTLALIQRRADDPQQVIRLARAQERELRSWLFGGRAPGSMDGLATTLAGGIRLIQQEVEAHHGVVVEVITVGDCPLNDDLSALLAAAREATVNAAKWSGVRVVSLFAEVEPEWVSVFVRDRGRGFDPAAVPADRKGLAESIRARMTRRGGSATVRSAPGEGTEVALTMPRTAAHREPSRTS